MRALTSSLVALTCVLSLAADPLPCIVLNGRAWAPADTMPAINAGPGDTRTMHDREYVAVRAVADGLGGRIRWGGCPGGHCLLCLADREIPLRLCEGRSYWHVVDPGGIDWWHVGTRPAGTYAARSQPSTASTPTPIGDPTVYVTATGECYHTLGCQYLSRSSMPMPLSQARMSYRPCSRCDPPR